jgi:hypothetical protein
MNSYQMVLHRPVETARVFTKFTLQEVQRIEVGENPVFRQIRLKRESGWKISVGQSQM